MEGTILDEHKNFWKPHHIDYQGHRRMWLEHGISASMSGALGWYFMTEDGEWITGEQVLDHGFYTIKLATRSRILWMYAHNYCYLLNKGDTEGFQRAMASLYYQSETPMSALERRWIQDSMDKMAATRDALLKKAKENREKRKGVKLDG